MTTQADLLVASDYVVCATLRKIADVFNVELLWERVRGGPEGIFLMEALKRHPRAARSRLRKETRYSHIIIRIPERDYVRDERLEDGFYGQTLLQDLRRLHEQELGRYLADNATIRYRLEADPTLRTGEAQFVFGRAIYVPDPAEIPLFWIQAAAEGAGDWRTIGPIYAGQRLTLLNGDRRAGSFTVAGWPFPGSESVLLMLRPGTPALVDVVAEPPGGLMLTSQPDGSFIARDRRGRGLRLRVVEAGQQGQPPMSAQSGVVIEPPLPPPLATPAESLQQLPLLAESPAEPSPPVAAEPAGWSLTDPWGRREPWLGLPEIAADPSASPPTAGEAIAPVLVSAEPASPRSPGLEQPTWTPRQPMTWLRVCGIALQRLSAYAAAGVSDWRIGFSQEGSLAPSTHPDAVAWLRIDQNDVIFGEIIGLVEPLEPPTAWRPFAEWELELYPLPAAMAGHYLGWVRLPEGLSIPVPRERAVSFGRGSEADIAPRLLADPRSLRWDGQIAQTPGINAEYLGLSRRHLRLEARETDWLVQVESRNMPAYRLTAAGALLDILTPQVSAAVTAAPGDLLVAGGYVLELGGLEAGE